MWVFMFVLWMQVCFECLNRSYVSNQALFLNVGMIVVICFLNS